MRRACSSLTWLTLILLVGCSEEAPVEDTPDSSPQAIVSAPTEIDPVTGLKMAGDWELVRGNCTACHSSKLITQQRGTAEQWLAMIRWMQKKQNLWQFDPNTEERIIAYLADNYPPDAAQRRAAIPRELMPPNPYAYTTVN